MAEQVVLDFTRGGNQVFQAKDLLPSYRQILKLLRQCDDGCAYAPQRLSLACADFILASATLMRQGSDTAAGQNLSSPATLKAIALVHSHLSDPLSVQDLAEAVDYQPPVFMKYFLGIPVKPQPHFIYECVVIVRQN